MAWRQWNYALHRDLGYLCVGLTLIYAVSGVLVNHTAHDFNPSYRITRVPAKVTPLETGNHPDSDYVRLVLEDLDEAGAFKNAAMLNPQTLRIFVEGNTIDVDLASGEALQEKVARRPLAFEINYLHLNKAKGAWTWLADIYAVLLGIIAVTGALMIRRRRAWRNLSLVGAGCILPLAYLLFVL